MKKKKILIFHTALATYRVDVFNALNEIYDVEVVFLFKNLWYYNMKQDDLVAQSQFKMSHLLTGPRYKGRVFRLGVYSKIKKTKPDYIFSYEYSFTTQYLIQLKKLGLIDQKIGSFIDDSMDISLNIQTKVRERARDRGIKYLDYFVLLSKEVAQFYKESFNLREEQVIVAPILQSPHRLRKDMNNLKRIAESYILRYKLANKKVLLYVGRLVEVKALPLFLNTAKRLLKNDEQLKFVVVGDGNELEKLQSIVAKESLEEKIIFVGEYQGAEVHAWYLAASGLILPSLFEPFGAVVNEALIFGLPVLISSRTGASSWIRAKHGLVFDPLNYRDVEKKLQEFVDKIQPVESNVNIDNKVCLMDFSFEKFKEEWQKLEMT